MSWLVGQASSEWEVAAKAALMYATAVAKSMIVHCASVRLSPRRRASSAVAMGAIIGRTAIAGTQSYLTGAVAVCTLVVIHRVASVLRFRPLLGKLFDHRIRVLVADGELRRAELRKCGLTDGDLFTQLRQRGVFAIEDVRYVLYEPKGSITTHTPTRPALYPDDFCKCRRTIGGVLMATGSAAAALLPIEPPLVRLLEEDPDLAENMPAEEREMAARALVVRVATAEPGEWDPPASDASSLGLLVLDGLLVRRLQLGSMPFAELLGPGDVLRPWEEGLAPDLLPALSGWKVLQPARFALLDRRANALIGRWPELNAAVASRILRRSRQLSYSMAAQHFFRVDDRLTAVLWRVALRWGRVRTDGILIPFRLSHGMLAEIICARRPSVTQAIGSLERQRRIRRTSDNRLVLLGEPPAWATHEPAPDTHDQALSPCGDGAG